MLELTTFRPSPSDSSSSASEHADSASDFLGDDGFPDDELVGLRPTRPAGVARREGGTGKRRPGRPRNSSYEPSPNSSKLKRLTAHHEAVEDTEKTTRTTSRRRSSTNRTSRPLEPSPAKQGRKRKRTAKSEYVPRPSSSRSFRMANAVADSSEGVRRRRQHSFETERLSTAVKRAKSARAETDLHNDSHARGSSSVAAGSTGEPSMALITYDVPPQDAAHTNIDSSRVEPRVKSEPVDDIIPPLPP